MKVRVVLLLLVGFVLVIGASAFANGDDVLTFGVTAEAETLDPHISMDNNTWRAIYYCYDRLVEYKGATTELLPGRIRSIYEKV